MKKLSVLIFVLLLPSLSLAGVKISGKITGADGKSLILGHVHLTNFQGNVRQPLQTETIARDGQFEVQVSEPGLYRILITAVNHGNLLIPLILDEKSSEIKIEAQLASLDYKDEFDAVQIIGDWNKFSFNTADNMEKQADGIFTYEREVTADTLSYQLLGITNDGRSVNGTQADFYIYDGGGDYQSVVKTEAGKVKVVFDPTKLFRGEKDLPKVVFEKQNEQLQKVWEIDFDIQNQRNYYMQAVTEYQKIHKNTKDFKFDWSETVVMLKDKMNNETDLIVQQFAAILLGGLISYRADVDSVSRVAIIDLLPANSAMWAAGSNLPMMLIRDAEKLKIIMEALTNENPNRVVRAVALGNMAMMANYQGDKEAAKEYYNKLKSDYGDVREIQQYLKQLDPNKRIMAGKTVPDFELTLMGSAEKISNKTLLGKFYLVDFWAVWCGPCVGEMEHLHKAYEKFKDKITFLSLSLDRKTEEVTKFRAEKWKMPWLHAFMGDEVNTQVTKTFEVMSIPKPILVNPEGKIIAIGSDLRGDKLEKILEKYLSK
ncbi:MAG: redoxin domain-containing protein [Bacteroidales bacterium]|nr:redoxin domain-containing protein [Bacteroidales bacterium]